MRSSLQLNSDFAQYGVQPTNLPGLTSEARRYALKELARRSGVTREFFNSWGIRFEPTATTISLSEPVCKIEFIHPPEHAVSNSNSEIVVARAGWPNSQPDS